MPADPIRVTVWHEHVHDRTNDAVKELYPDGMHAVMKDAIEEHLGSEAVVRTALLEEPEHGLTDADIFDVAAIAAGRCFLTRLLDGLGVEPDKAWMSLDDNFRETLSIGRPISQRALEFLPSEDAA